MHSDVSLEIAYSGEFFVRRVHHSAHPNSAAHPEREAAPDKDPSALPPSAYELMIDNDSGTYRPKKELLPVLAAFLARPENLGALGRVRAMDGFDARLKRWKDRRKEEKQRARGMEKGRGRVGVMRQASVSSSDSSSVSSSEDGEAVAAAEQEARLERHRIGGAREAEQDTAKENGH